MPFDWKDFRVFDDDCVLNAASLGAATLNESCEKFDIWLNNLRGLVNKPNHCGIPQARVGDVSNLLTKFFPSNRPFVNIAYREEGNDPTYHPNPTPVTLGNSTININDGGSALGYIFSIAQQPAPGSDEPPLPVKTFSSYGLPLITMFTRWVYLAYIKERNNPQNPNGDIKGMVPFMSCIMYTVDNAGAFQLFLGSTYVTDGVTPSLTPDSYQKRRIMNLWRREGVLDTNNGLAYFNPSRVNLLPNLPTVLKEAVCDAYFLLLRGITSVQTSNMTLQLPPDPDNPQAPRQPAVIQHTPSLVICDAARTAAELILQGLWSQAGKTEVIKPAPLNMVTSMKVLKPQIRSALEPIIELRFNAPEPYNRQDPQLQGLFAQLIRAYYMPHMFKSTGPNPENISGNGEKTLPGFPAALDAIVQAFWLSNGTAMLDVLDNLYYWVTNLDDALAVGGPSESRFGRCAETHPVVAVMPNLTPTRVLPAPNNPNNQPVTPVHGFAFAIRKLTIDAGNLLANNFTSDTLNSIHSPQNQFYRKPCGNCVQLLPRLEVRTGQTDYDTDLYTLYPNAQNGVS